jgi:hypothetical protein
MTRGSAFSQEKPSPIGPTFTASKSYNTQTDFRFDMKTFMELRNAQSVTIAYDGLNPIPPTFCYLKPYYNDRNKSYFEQLAAGEL